MRVLFGGGRVAWKGKRVVERVVRRGAGLRGEGRGLRGEGGWFVWRGKRGEGCVEREEGCVERGWVAWRGGCIKRGERGVAWRVGGGVVWRRALRANWCPLFRGRRGLRVINLTLEGCIKVERERRVKQRCVKYYFWILEPVRPGACVVSCL